MTGVVHRIDQDLKLFAGDWVADELERQAQQLLARHRAFEQWCENRGTP